MTIAINSTSFTKSAGNDFLYNYLLRMATSQTQHRFIFISNTDSTPHSSSNENIIHVISSPRGDNPVMWKIWLNYTLPAITKKYQADLLINTSGACALRSKIPQWLFLSDLSFLTFPRYFSRKQLYFLTKNTAAFLGKAINIVTTANFLKKEITAKYAIDEKKITVFQLPASPNYQPVSWQEKEIIKEKYASGKEYFLFTGNIHPRYNLLNLLKAFSFFKKRQKSNMQLVIATARVAANDPFIESLQSFKYRNEVVVLRDLAENDLASLTAAAYAFIYPVAYEGAGLPILQAMQCEVPFVTTDLPAIRELAGKAALYADPENFDDIAVKMMLVFKDENQRADLIKQGSLAIKENNAADFLWNMMTQKSPDNPA